MPAEARFKKTGLTIFGKGPKGSASLVADGVLLRYDDGPPVHVRFGDLRKAGFNSNNGMWTFYPKEGKNLNIQTTGRFFSVGDRAAGERFNVALADAVEKSGIKNFGV